MLMMISRRRIHTRTKTEIDAEWDIGLNLFTPPDLADLLDHPRFERVGEKPIIDFYQDNGYNDWGYNVNGLNAEGNHFEASQGEVGIEDVPELMKMIKAKRMVREEMLRQLPRYAQQDASRGDSTAEHE